MIDFASWQLREPGDYLAAHELLCEELSARVVGHEEAIRILALCGVRHLAGMGRQRLLLIGPSGCGKSTLLRALAETLGVPFGFVDITMMSEMNWQGTDLGAVFSQLRARHGELADRAVVLLDEIDKVCVRGMAGSSREYRLGKQQSLLPLLGLGSAIPIGSGSISPDGMLVVMAGVFAGLPHGSARPDDLVRRGLIPEIVERFGTILRLRPLSVSDLTVMFRRELEVLYSTFTAFGWNLSVPDSTLRYAAAAVSERFGPRSASTMLRDACDRRLLHLIASRVPVGTAITLTPDDLLLPGDYRRPRELES